MILYLAINQSYCFAARSDYNPFYSPLTWPRYVMLVAGPVYCNPNHVRHVRISERQTGLLVETKVE